MFTNDVNVYNTLELQSYFDFIDNNWKSYE